MAEGGCGGNSAMPEREKKVDSPAVLLSRAGHNRKILFSLEEKEIGRGKVTVLEVVTECGDISANIVR